MSHAIDLLRSLGVDAIAAHIQRYHDALEPKLVARGFTSLREPSPQGRSGILSLRPPPDIEVIALNAALSQREIACSTPDGKLRFSPHWPNALAEVDAIDDALADALAELRGG